MARRIALPLVVLVVGSCGDLPVEDTSSSGISEIELVPRLVITGEELGEEYGFGSVADTEFLSDGSIAVLDRMRCSVFVYSVAGDYLYAFGREGCGPGEFTSPECMFAFDDSLVVVDRRSARMTVFDRSGDYLGELSGTLLHLPTSCVSVGPAHFLGGITTVAEDTDEIELIYMVNLFDLQLGTVDTLFTNRFAYNPEDIACVLRSSVFSCSFAADENENLFISRTSTAEYAVLGLTADRDTLLHIERDLEPVAKTPEEIAWEKELMEASLEVLNPGTDFDYQPLPERFMIPAGGLHTDGRGRLWVRNGLSRDQVFDVYDYSGERICVVEALGIDPEDAAGPIRWHISDSGLIASTMNAYEDPKAYVYDLPEGI